MRTQAMTRNHGLALVLGSGLLLAALGCHKTAGAPSATDAADEGPVIGDAAVGGAGGMAGGGGSGGGQAGSGGSVRDATSDLPGTSVDTRDAGVCDHELANVACWSSFNTSRSEGALHGGAFDGRYVYFTSSDTYGENEMTRYDTQSSFGDRASWSSFNTATLPSHPYLFRSAAFDGRYLYYPPFSGQNVALSYDTQASFKTATAWSTFDLGAANGTPADKGVYYVGAAFDGRYIYFIPNFQGTAASGLISRYDTQGSFASAASWSSFDMTTVNPSATGYRGVTFDGRYLYLVPYGNYPQLSPNRAQMVARYDTQASFTEAASWATFDTTTLSSAASGYAGAAFDGRYVYLVPEDSISGNGWVTRYDTQAGFTAAASWSLFSTRTVDRNAYGFNGAVFDGRYLYLVPSMERLLARYDTQAVFDAASSWSTFDLYDVGGKDGQFAGGVFDGRYVYLVPFSSGIVVRFDAKTPPGLPARNNASFY